MSKPIRVLQVLTVMNRGGAETMIMNYYRGIDRSKVQFDFLLHRKAKGVFDDEIRALGGKIFTLQNLSFGNLPSYIKELDKFFKNHPEYKIVHAHINAFSVFVLRAAKKNNVPIRIAHSHTSLYNLNLNPFSKERHSLDFAVKFIAQNAFKLKINSYANHLFSCGKKAGEWLYGKNKTTKVILINNAINTDAFIYDTKTSQEAKRDLGLKDKLVIGHVGNFVPEKNHAFIINVYLELRKLNPNTSLLLVGNYNKKNLEEMIGSELPNDIIALGLRSDVPNILQAMDMFIFPSTNEGLPVTLIEAQASGLKIKASASITDELKITNLIEFISLDKSYEYWAKSILSSVPYDRINTKDKIIKGGYDIKSNAQNLQVFYINQLLKNN